MRDARREWMADAIAASWPAGICHFCGIPDERVDGDRIRWVDSRRAVCSQPGCVRRFGSEVEKALHAARPKRKRSPAEVHALILEERRRKRREYRLRRKGRAA